MSATDFYLSKGFTPTWKTVSFNGAGTATVWTPRASTRIVLTRIVAANTNAGSMAFYYGNLAGTKIVEFRFGGSSTIDVSLDADSGTVDRTLVGNVTGGGTDGNQVTLTGFEIPT